MRRPVRRTQAQEVNLPAPVKGLVQTTPAQVPEPFGAEWLENWVPTLKGIRVRGGRSRAAFVTDAVKSLFSFADPASPSFFAATADAIYDVSSLNPTTAPTAAASGLTSGDWSAQQIGVSGGDYLLAANGADHVQIYNGGTWNPLADEAISDLDYDALTADFAVGETVTGGTSGASATIYGVIRTSPTAGTLKVGTVASGPFQDNEAITSAGGAAVVDGTITSASSLTVSGVDTSALSHVWLYQNRLFFVEGNTQKAWYLPVGSVGGTANDINLAGVFRRGGSLLFGATWSVDSGDGLDDKCVFVSTEGEVAIYSGIDPSDASAWALEGRYDIGVPLGKRASVTVGGDLMIATDDGIVPLSAALNRDPSALKLGALTQPIQDLWTQQVDAVSDDVELIRWTEENMMAVVFPGATWMLTVNLQTGAWAQQTGWSGQCARVYLGSLYVGRDDGRVYKVDDTGTDDGDSFTARACFAFTDLGGPTQIKAAQMMRAAFYSAGTFNYALGIATDYNVSFPPAPNAAAANDGTMIWGTSDWGAAEWGSTIADPKFGDVQLWRSVTGTGHVIAPTVQVTSGDAARLEVELLSVNLTLGVGGRAA